MCVRKRKRKTEFYNSSIPEYNNDKVMYYTYNLVYQFRRSRDEQTIVIVVIVLLFVGWSYLCYL